MSKLLRPLCAIWCFVIFSTSAIADVNITTGNCSPVLKNSSQLEGYYFRCDTYNGVNYIYTIDDLALSTFAEHYAVQEVAIKNLLALMGEEKVAPYEVPRKLEELVELLRSQKAQLETIAVDASIRADWQATLSAISRGDIREALRLSELVISKSESGVQAAFKTLADQARFRQTRGRLLMSLSDTKKAFEEFNAALNMIPPQLELLRTQLTVDAAESAALDGADDDIEEKLIDSAMLLTEPYADQFPAMRMTGITLRQRYLTRSGDAAGAIKFFEQVAQPFIKRHKIKNQHVGWCYSCVASALIDLDDAAGAKKILEAAIEEMTKANPIDWAGLVPIYYNMVAAKSYLGEAGESYYDLTLSAADKAYHGDVHPDYTWVYGGMCRKAQSESEVMSDYCFKSLEMTIKIYRPDEADFWGQIDNIIGQPGVMIGDLNLGGWYASEQDIDRLFAILRPKIDNTYLKLHEEGIIYCNNFVGTIGENDNLENAGNVVNYCMSLARDQDINSKGSAVSFINLARLGVIRNLDADKVRPMLRKALARADVAFGAVDEMTYEFRKFVVQYELSLGSNNLKELWVLQDLRERTATLEAEPAVVARRQLQELENFTVE